MALQLILGGSGSGKSYYAYDLIIKQAIENPKTNYILLVPEQYSMALQRKMVMMHPSGGTMNIDVIGFNRLAYRVFDELNVKTDSVLQDFGKSMLIRQIAGQMKNELKVFGGCINKIGFIDEIKSLMSELFQYNINKEQIRNVINNLDLSSDELLYNKLCDIEKIYNEFEAKIDEKYIVAEQLTQLLAEYIDKSELIKNSVIVMDGFTGFTPIQNVLIEKLLVNAKQVYSIFTIDEKNYYKKNLAEYELFYLTKQSINKMKYLANKTNTKICDDILIGFGNNAYGRWTDQKDLIHLEKNIFRYPYEKYDGKVEHIKLFAFENPRKEIEGIAYYIRELIRTKGYRYKDIGVITGNLEGAKAYVQQIFPLYNIPHYIDSTEPVRNNQFVDAIEHALNIVKENFSYDSVFSFLKSGIVSDLSDDDIEILENYVLSRGIKGASYWNRAWNEAVEDIRQCVVGILMPFYKKLYKKNIEVKVFVEAVRELMDTLSYESKMEECIKLYESILELLNKMVEIIGSDNVIIDEFIEIFKVGLKDVNIGSIPSTLDMVLVGDITRSRFDDIKVLIVMDVNDGIIPKKSSGIQLIGDKDKEKLNDIGMELAPTDKVNSFVQQFYLYMNMTKPSNELVLSYTYMGSNNDKMRPSYIISRIKNLFTNLEVCSDFKVGLGTLESSIDLLIDGLKDLSNGNTDNINRTLRLYKLYLESGNKAIVDIIEKGINYNNVPKSLCKEVTDLINLRLLSQSVSRLEAFSKCAYSYFLRHTLGLKERLSFDIDNRGVGNILHRTMEKLFRHVHDNLDNKWESISENKLIDITNDFVEQAFSDELFNDSSDEFRQELNGKYKYIKQSLSRIGIRTAKTLKSLMESDSLMPEYFEYTFTKDYKNEDVLMNLRGIVDRGDVFYSKDSNSIRLRIIDYKSGNYDFKISKLYEGLQLQLSVYMDIMLEMVKAMPGNNEVNSVIAEGMYYYQMQDPYIIADSVEKASEERKKTLKYKGLVNNDNEYFENILKFAKKKSLDIAKEISEGVISKNPIVEDGGSACDYCSYKEVCRFDDKEGKNSYRFPKYSERDKDVIYSEIVKALEE